MPHRFAAALLLLLLAAIPAAARVISYAPYSDRVGVPAVGLRLNRHFAVVETANNFFVGGTTRGQLVLYDSQGLEEPRVILPQDGSEANFSAVAVRERAGEPTVIFAAYSDSQGQKNRLSTDGGQTWKNVALAGTVGMSTSPVDVGGFYARSRYNNVRIGNFEYPFVVVNSLIGVNRVTAIALDGSTKELIGATSKLLFLAGSDLERRRFLVYSDGNISMVDLNAVQTTVGPIEPTATNAAVEGWITSTGSAYIEQYRSPSDISLWLYEAGHATFIAGTYDKTNPSAVPPQPPSGTSNPFFAVPTATYGGAWMISRAVGAPTRLLSHDQQRGLIEHWSDITAPEVEALHPSVGGDKVLIQVHRPRRAADQLLFFKDPAIAVWHVGQGAPRFYDELYLAEAADKGFLILDVDAVESGDPFVFDAGRAALGLITSPGGGNAGGGGGGDVVQEWGVVRASLKQSLVLPGIARQPGAVNSYWLTDLVIHNPLDTQQRVNAAARVVARYLDLGHPVGPLIATMARGVLREDADFELHYAARSAPAGGRCDSTEDRRDRARRG